MIDLNQMLRETKRQQRLAARDTQGQERLHLDNVHGELRQQGARLRCLVLDIGMAGCCVETEQEFRAGAVAEVELSLPVYGATYRQQGTTQWVDDGNLIGIQFFLPNAPSRIQLASVLRCLKESGSPDALRAAVECGAIKFPPGLGPAKSNPKLAHSSTMDAVNLVHKDSVRVHSRKAAEWAAEIRLIHDSSTFTGSVLELSQDGVSVRLTHSYAAELDQQAEVILDVDGQHFRMAGTPRAVHEEEIVGFQFTSMPLRRREQLAQLIQEIAEESTQMQSTDALKS